jgi:hypothetical protein
LATSLEKQFDIVLSPDEARQLSLFIQSSAWRGDIESTLQGLSCDDTGDLLTGWMPVERFEAFAIAAAKESYLVAIADRIQSHLPSWKSHGIDEVCFDWYDKK